MKKPTTNFGHSARARLLALARREGVQLEYVLLRYAFERFLWRLGKTAARDSFVLKGASAFAVWLGPFVRVTRDADLEAFGDSSPDGLLSAFQSICAVPCPEDGVSFDETSFSAAPIRKQGRYPGVRVSFRANIGGARVALQFDIGFGDSVHPAASFEDYPALLGGEPPRVRTYPRYSVVAEKFQAMVALDMANSRLKDFYDVWLLSERFDFDRDLLRSAIERTFARRETGLPDGTPSALTARYATNPAKTVQWAAFMRNAGIPEHTLSLETAVERIRLFLLPVLQSEAPAMAIWKAGKGWTADN